MQSHHWAVALTIFCLIGSGGCKKVVIIKPGNGTTTGQLTAGTTGGATTTSGTTTGGTTTSGGTTTAGTTTGTTTGGTTTAGTTTAGTTTAGTATTTTGGTTGATAGPARILLVNNSDFEITVSINSVEIDTLPPQGSTTVPADIYADQNQTVRVEAILQAPDPPRVTTESCTFNSNVQYTVTYNDDDVNPATIVCTETP